MRLVEVTSVSPLEHHAVELTFDDGTVKRVDLDPYLRGPIFEPLLRDDTLFRAVRVDPELGTIVWPNGADIDAQVLRYDLRPAAWDDR